jgi:phage gpG-like protein
MIQAWIIGSEEVIARLERVPEQVRGALRRAISIQAFDLMAYVKASKLSGQVLRTRSDHLRGGINVKLSGDGLSARVGPNVKYARVHEYGGAFTIREHMRMMTQAFGRPVKEPRKISVREHVARYPERSFLRSSLRENEGRIRAAIEAAVTEGVKG